MRKIIVPLLSACLAGSATLAGAQTTVEADVPLFNPQGCDVAIQGATVQAEIETDEDGNATGEPDQARTECHLKLVRSDGAPRVVIERIPRHPEATIRELGDERDKRCKTTLQQVREERGQPMLQRGTASPDEPLLIAAVEHRIDGCSVMIMRNDISDLRPVPEASNTGGLIPAS